MTARERLQLLVVEFGEEQAEHALELLSPLTGAAGQPGQQVPQLPPFVGTGDSGRSDISEHVNDLLAGASASSLGVIPIGTTLRYALPCRRGQASRALRRLPPACS